jgi:hypothetical protein
VADGFVGAVGKISGFKRRYWSFAAKPFGPSGKVKEKRRWLSGITVVEKIRVGDGAVGGEHHL